MRANERQMVETTDATMMTDGMTGRDYCKDYKWTTRHNPLAQEAWLKSGIESRCMFQQQHSKL